MAIQLVVLLLALLSWSQPRELSLCHGAPTGHCMEVERRALMEFKAKLKDPIGLLSSWVGKDCCSWSGVACSNETGRIIQLNLRNPEQEYCASRSKGICGLEGEIPPSLLSLQHLTYLDLSGHYLRGSPIPPFIGSFRKLKYLNLSCTGFSGIVPHRLANLSSLLSLDIHRNFYVPYPVPRVDDCQWLSRLTSLRYLDMSYLDLGRAPNCLQALNVLPSITEIRLQGCKLDSIPPSLPHLNFTSLSLLDLSSNDVGSTIPGWLFELTSLQYLDLSYNINLQVLIPDSIGNMTSLRVLGLPGLQGSIPDGFGKLCRLQSLYLSMSDVTHISPQFARILSGCIKHSLEELHLDGASLTGVPSWIGDLKNLGYLRLSYNSIESMPGFLFGLRSLRYLDLSDNNLHGPVPDAIGNMTSLVHLDLSENPYLEVPLPETLGNLCNLQTLSLAWCNISCRLDELGGNFAGGCIRHSLRELQAFENSLRGSLPAWIGDLPLLQELKLDQNQLNGTIPESLGRLAELVELDLRNNSLEGDLSEAHFANLTRLKYLLLSGNNLTMKVGIDWVPRFRLQALHMGPCLVGPQFPTWLKSQDALLALDLSRGGISSAMPDWFWNLTSISKLYYLDLSHNEISGVLPHLHSDIMMLDLSHNLFSGSIPAGIRETMPFLQYLYLSSNRLEGPLPYFPSEISVLDLSNNSFPGPIPPLLGEKMPALQLLSFSMNNLSGSIPPSVCQLEQLQALVLSKNQLSGEVPDCWKKSSNLQALDLANNNLSGGIPDTLCSQPLSSLHLSNNILSGELPISLKSCKGVVVLDMSHNRLTGDIPSWLGESLSNLRILSLRSNMFSGQLPPTLSHLKALQILDLAQNHISGGIPRDLGNFSAMMSKGNIASALDSTAGYYDESIDLDIKNREMVFDKLLSLVIAIDLSDNCFSGDIPDELANLLGLQSLNLSRNHLTGDIPSKIGEMRRLESLDLSSNDLSGIIPPALSELTFLSALNLSYNNLSGAIPTGGQLSTFVASSYIGNHDLCGFPLPNCRSNQSAAEAPVSADHPDEAENEMFWLHLSIGSGFAVGLWAVWVLFLLKKRWRDVYFQFIDNMFDNIYVAVMVKVRKLRHSRK